MNFLKKNIKWICHHAHLDKSNLINKESLHKTTVHMQDKWFIMEEYKKNYSTSELYERMNRSVENIVSQNCKNIRSFIDVDSTVGLMCVKSADKLRNQISKNVNIVVVSKTQSTDKILEVYNYGYKEFGENKVQELVEKHSILPKNIKWHFIGKLQRNKVKNIVPFVYLIHSVDNFKLLDEINKRAKNLSRVIDCLIQIKIAEEDNKSGFNINELDDVMKYSKTLENINIVGLMGMSTFTNNQKIIEDEFSILRKAFNKRKSKNFRILSMGMSNDFNIAIDKGSNMIRLGSIIFGKRN